MGFVALESFTRAAILKTTDGGLTWTRIEVHDPQGNANLEGIGFLDEQTGWVGGWGSASFAEGSAAPRVMAALTWEDANEIGRFINRFRFAGRPVTVAYASGRTVYKYSAEPVPVPVAAAAPIRLFDNELAKQRPPGAHPAGRCPQGTERLSVRVWGRFGEPLRHLVDESAPAPGERTIEWDGTDDAGAAADGSVIVRVAVDGNAEGQILHLTR